MSKYLLDTSIIIEALRLHNLEAERFLHEKYAGKLCVSVISVAELFSGQSAQDREVARYLKYLISSFELVGLDLETATLAGQLRCNFKISMPDALLAATALANNLQLITHNKKDFAKVPNLKMALVK